MTACHQNCCIPATVHEDLFTGSDIAAYAHVINSYRDNFRDPTNSYPYVPLQWTTLQDSNGLNSNNNGFPIHNLCLEKGPGIAQATGLEIPFAQQTAESVVTGDQCTFYGFAPYAIPQLFSPTSDAEAFGLTDGRTNSYIPIGFHAACQSFHSDSYFSAVDFAPRATPTIASPAFTLLSTPMCQEPEEYTAVTTVDPVVYYRQPAPLKHPNSDYLNNANSGGGTPAKYRKESRSNPYSRLKRQVKSKDGSPALLQATTAELITPVLPPSVAQFTDESVGILEAEAIRAMKYSLRDLGRPATVAVAAEENAHAMLALRKRGRRARSEPPVVRTDSNSSAKLGKRLFATFFLKSLWQQPKVTEYLFHWLMEHQHEPYPSEEEKKEMTEHTGLNLNQINDWFINARRRYLEKPRS
ncbi:hypothetical protein HDU83_009684 [Entophlyctis luteolus]|nr:hypothetical protein HDU83_009684 [Entophlyctis luteolus]